MKLATQIRYSIRILLDLAMHRADEVVQMRDMARRQGISLKYLEQLIRPFKENGFVKARRGRNGGYRLVVSPDQITLARIIRVFDKEQQPGDVPEDREGYPGHQDSLIREAWDEAMEAFYSRLEKVSLADLSLDTTKRLWSDSDILVFL